MHDNSDCMNAGTMADSQGFMSILTRILVPKVLVSICSWSMYDTSVRKE